MQPVKRYLLLLTLAGCGAPQVSQHVATYQCYPDEEGIETCGVGRRLRCEPNPPEPLNPNLPQFGTGFYWNDLGECT